MSGTINDNSNTSGVGGAGMLVNSPNRLGREQKRPYVVAIVVLMILALGGVGFGIYGMVMRSQVQREMNDLNVEKVLEDDSQEVEEGAEVEIQTDCNTISTEASMARDYIYVGEWGIKIKVSDKLAAVSYVFNNAVNTLYVTGALKDRGQYVPSFVSNLLDHGSGLVALSRYHKDDVAGTATVGKMAQANDGYALGEVLYVDGDWFYTYQHAQAAYGTESERQWEIDSAAEISEMLKKGTSAF